LPLPLAETVDQLAERLERLTYTGRRTSNCLRHMRG